MIVLFRITQCLSSGFLLFLKKASEGTAAISVFAPTKKYRRTGAVSICMNVLDTNYYFCNK